MNRNTELHFGHTPHIDLKRSKFDMSHSNKTTFNTGDIIPIFCDTDILPGDTVQVDLASLVRMATPIYPIMDNLYLDTYWFYVPHRLVWEHWQEFWGENEDPWARTTQYEVPQIKAPSEGWEVGTVADYIGLPIGVQHEDIDVFAFRSYVKIWNDFFRDQNLKQAAHMYKDDTTRQGVNSGDYVLNAELGGKPLKAAKLHDFYTSCLPSPQKGPAVTIPIGSDSAPVTGKFTTAAKNIQIGNQLATHDNTAQNPTPWPVKVDDAGASNVQYPLFAKQNFMVKANTGVANTETSTLFITNAAFKTPANTQNVGGQTPASMNLVADLSSATAASINALRMAFAIQKYYENAGLHGTRYIEYIRSVFGVTSSDARMQRAEYLGGKRIPLNIDQVLQTSSTDNTSPQGNTAGFSCTFDKHSAFTKSFEEHGTLMCLAVVRTEHTYQDGIPKQFLRKTWEQFYNPFFANLGEQLVENQQLYAQAKGTAANKEAFGYQEAWAEYRYKENRVSGYMRSKANGSLDVWHFADDYSTLPTLGTTWIDEPYENVDRTIAVTSQLNHQYIADFFFKMYYTRPMPVYSVPGLIDHV